MDRNEFEDFVEGHYQDIMGLNKTKGHEYAGDEDALANFKEVAKEHGITPEQAWGVYTSKHWKAIQSFIREGQVHSEPIEGRIQDVILYCFLLLGLIEDGTIEVEEERITGAEEVTREFTPLTPLSENN